MGFTEFKASSVDDAITEASLSLGVPSTDLVYEIVEEGSNGFLGIGRKPAIINARVKEDGEIAGLIQKKEEIVEDKPKFKMEIKDDQVKVDTFNNNKTSINKKSEPEKKNVIKEESKPVVKEEKIQTAATKTVAPKKEETAKVENEVEKKEPRVVVNPENIDEILDKTKAYLDELFATMKIETEVSISFDKEKNDINIDLAGDDMGVLIGKRGNTLDSLQYLTSLYCNKLSTEYLRVKMDTENYRERRKKTLEHLAKNIAFKVKKTRRPVYLEPMNPYERRIIHSALQNDRYVTTRSEGEEPYRKVVVVLKK